MKKSTHAIHENQLGFDVLLAETDTINKAVALEKALGHLPSTMDEALPLYEGLIRRHSAAMMDGDIDRVMSLRQEAHNLALRLNDGEPGILAGQDAPGCRLEALTPAPHGAVPFWGAAGSFTLDIDGMMVLVKLDGMFGIGSRFCPWMGFSASAVKWSRPFLSETGFRSFLGIQAALQPGYLPDRWVAEILTTYVKVEMKGRLRRIDKQYRPETAKTLTGGVKFDNIGEELSIHAIYARSLG